MPHRRWKILACLFLFLATVAVYGEVRNHQFVNLDDTIYVSENPRIQGGLTLTGLVWAFTTLHAGLWIPLTWLSYMWDSQLFGLHPGGFHLTNLFFHLANTLLLFLWLHRTSGALGRSFLVAALFALHPLHVESVAWVTERKDVLSTFFWLLTMWVYLWYVAGLGMKRYLLALACFSLGLMAKPMVVTLPLVLLLLDYWPLRRWPGWGSPATGPGAYPGVPIKHLLWEKVPFLALATLFSVVTIHAQKTMGAVVALERIPMMMRMANALVAYVSYMYKMIWPTHLAVYYPYSSERTLILSALVAGLILSVLSFLIVRQTRRRSYLAVGWLWFLITLLPVIGLVQVGGQAMADRFTYVPLIGLFIMVAWGMVDLTAGWRLAKFPLQVSAGVVLSALMVCTWVQVRYWRDSITLFEHALEVTRRNAVIHNNLGIALAKQGKLDQAIVHFAEVVRLKPDFAEAHYNLGNALAKQDKLDQAIVHYAEAVRLKPGLAEVHNNLGNALEKQGKLDQAIAHYQEALRLRPKYPEAHNYLGVALAKQGKLDQAIAHFQEALRLRPKYPEAHSNLGAALSLQGKVDQAIAHYQEAIALKSDYSEALNNLAYILATSADPKFRDGTKAVQLAMQANKLSGSRVPGIMDTLAAAYAEAGRFSEAIEISLKARELERSNSKAIRDIDEKIRLYQDGRPYHKARKE